jgi:uncharacterized membrane protein
MREKRDRWSATAALIVLLFILSCIVVINIVRSPQPFPLTGSPSLFTDTQTTEARIVKVIRADPASPVQQIELQVVSGPLRGEQAQIILDATEAADSRVVYQEGDHVLVDVTTRADGSRALNITDLVRTGTLGLLSALLVGSTIVVSGWKGIRALIGLAISFVVLLGFVVPRILAGQDAVFISVTGACVLLAVTLYLTLGWSLKTHAALLGVFFTLILIGLLSTFAVDLTRLNGASSEDTLMLQAAGVSLNLRGLLLAGMIVGTLGILDDVVVTQVSTVIELAQANPILGWRELYRRAMNIGHDHIAATINTLALAYVGAAMPVLLLFQLYPEPWSVTINRGFVAEEIVRTLVGSLGLVSAVPISTLTASLLYHWQAHRVPPLTR